MLRLVQFVRTCGYDVPKLRRYYRVEENDI